MAQNDTPVKACLLYTSLMRMGEPGVPTVEEYCGKVLPENGVLGLCGLTASCGLVRGVHCLLYTSRCV